jgi:phosphoribosyl-ATP pyrophosphohydrolase
VDENDERLAEETADLIYNLLVLLESRGVSINKVGEVLQQRTQKKK